MLLSRGFRSLTRQLRSSQRPNQLLLSLASDPASRRCFSVTRNLRVVKPVLLADIGEGIVECEIIQWFVEPGARVEEFSPLCEVQSDKASVEITSRFSGVVKKLYYEAGEMARVGKPFVDIDIQGGAKEEDLAALTPNDPQETITPQSPPPQTKIDFDIPPEKIHPLAGGQSPLSQPNGKHASLATPAVRHLSRELNIDISSVSGTGRDGRVLKEDLYKFAQARQSGTQPTEPVFNPATPSPAPPGGQTETLVQLTSTQLHMFRTMTKSLTIPHFLYADEVDFSNLCELRARLNRVLAASPAEPDGVTKLTYLPLVIKAVSMALARFPVLNARVGADPATGRPLLALRGQHNVGVAMDTPAGLVVPVVHDVAAKNVLAVAAELRRLQTLALAGRLAPADVAGGTVTVSNIGSIGGTYLSPVIVDGQVAILGIGRMRAVPAFDDAGNVVRRQVCNFSWSADHRVVDGATMARAAEEVRRVVEEPDVMVMHLR